MGKLRQRVSITAPRKTNEFPGEFNKCGPVQCSPAQLEHTLTEQGDERVLYTLYDHQYGNDSMYDRWSPHARLASKYIGGFRIVFFPGGVPPTGRGHSLSRNADARCKRAGIVLGLLSCVRNGDTNGR